jgi:hypothetical protein
MNRKDVMNREQLPDTVQHYQPLPGTPTRPVQLPDGRWVYAPQMQAPPPQTIVVQMPEQRSMPPWLRDLMVVVVMLLVVAVVLVGCVCAVVVVAGGTIMGIVGAVGANAQMLGVSTIGILLAAGWLVSKVKGGKDQSKG